MKTCVVGIGKLGLPVAVHIAGMGHEVIGADIDEQLVDNVNQGIEPFPGEPELAGRLADVHARGLLSATTDTAAAVAECDAVILLVALIVGPDRDPIFTAMDAATTAIGEGLRPGTLVSYETTLPVGTARNRFAPRLEELSGLTVGEDLFVVHSPERVMTGRVFSDLRRYPKLVGGVTEACTDQGMKFYETILEFDDRPDLPKPNGVWRMASVETAEMTKLAETTYRNVNIGLANEYARFAEANGINVYDVIGAANSQVFSHIHQPGASVGGHCIPVYPHLYMLNDTETTVPVASVAANESMPAHMVDLLETELGASVEGERVAVLGLCYRGGAKEDAFSGTYPLAAELERRGATALVHDPMYDDDELRAKGFTPYDGGDVVGAVVHTDHAEYRSFGPSDLPGARVIVDGRNMLSAGDWPGVSVRTLGVAPELR
ncbi:MAG: nucleotide sugar dehydrogenase [Actinomycetota bacterium]